MGLDIGCLLRNYGRMEVQLDKVLLKRGLRFADLARRLGVDKATVTRWGQKGIPAERVPDVERLTGISRHELRPDLWDTPDSEAVA